MLFKYIKKPNKKKTKPQKTVKKTPNQNKTPTQLKTHQANRKCKQDSKMPEHKKKETKTIQCFKDILKSNPSNLSLPSKYSLTETRDTSHHTKTKNINKKSLILGTYRNPPCTSSNSALFLFFPKLKFLGCTSLRDRYAFKQGPQMSTYSFIHDTVITDIELRVTWETVYLTHIL